jgi:hypothetical protein|tara:strand:- start:942 stop:1295 length:354 start_codon:yes stop_codon:yes gene_type:complete
MKNILLIICLVFVSVGTKADLMRDVELSNQLLAYAEYGGKVNWSISELNNLEKKVSLFSDENLKQIWIGNIAMYSLMGDGSMRPSRAYCQIAKRNISKINDKDIRSLWNTNYNLYGC